MAAVVAVGVAVSLAPARGDGPVASVREGHWGPADLNGDQSLDGPDLRLFRQQWMEYHKTGTGAADLDCNGAVDFADAVTLVEEWLKAEEGGGPPPAIVNRVQVVQDYQCDLGTQYGYCTHLGTDCGRMGPAEAEITWDGGLAAIGSEGGPLSDWAGVWHSLAGLRSEEGQTIDFTGVYPAWIRPEFQPQCVGIRIRLKGKGCLKLEITEIVGSDERPLWQTSRPIDTVDQFVEYRFGCSPEQLRRAKLLTWKAGKGSVFSIDRISLLLQAPDTTASVRAFLTSYAKLSRCYSRSEGIVRDKAHLLPGQQDCIPASGLFCLATCAAAELSIVDRAFAVDTLHRVDQTVSGLPRAHGLLPHFVCRNNGTYDTCAEYSTVDTSLYYHAMLIAAQMIGDTPLVDELITDIKQIEFGALRDQEGWIRHGVARDGQNLLNSVWKQWGGETTLVLLLARMAGEEAASLSMETTGSVYNGTGFIAELQSLFYPQFSQDTADALTGVNWLEARQELLQDQRGAVLGTEAGDRGIYGLSAGEAGCNGGYVANGTEAVQIAHLLHPHYMLMSGALRPDPQVLYGTLSTMEDLGLFAPWGLVENVQDDLTTSLPMLGALNASYEAIGAYHLHAKATGQSDALYQAAEGCEPLSEAIELFYGDGPKPWSAQSSGTSEDLTGVCFIDQSQGWVVGAKGTILHTTDGGLHWGPQVSGTDADLWAISCVAPGYARVKGYGLDLRTRNGGTDWVLTAGSGGDFQVTGPDQEWEVRSGACLGCALYSSDGGASWALRNDGLNEWVNSICLIDADTGWVANNWGRVWRTTDRGITWIEQITPTSGATGSVIQRVRFGDRLNGWAILSQQWQTHCLHTRNGGQEWVLERLPQEVEFTSRFCAIGEDMWCPAGATIVKRTGAGQTLRYRNPDGGEILGIHFVDPDHGWAVGTGGTILRYAPVE